MGLSERNRYIGTNFITGMRAFAALGVVFIHTGGLWFREWGEEGNRLANLGAAGVFVFFVISGFAVSQSFVQAPSYGVYLKKRLNRIIPLYFFWLAICTLVLGVGDVGLYNTVMHLSFLSFIDFRVANSIIGVEWTIAVEVVFYLLIPLLLWKPLGVRWLVIVAAASFVTHRALQAWLIGVANEDWLLALHWSPIPYAFPFVLGVMAHRLRGRRENAGWISDASFLTAATVMLGFVLMPGIFSHPWADTLTVVSLVTFAILCAGADFGMAAALLRHRVTQFLGRISYGIYLSHFPIFKWLIEPLNTGHVWAFVLTLSLSVFASTLTWLTVEKVTLWPVSNLEPTGNRRAEVK